MRSIGCILLFMSLCAGFTSCQKELVLTNPLTDSTGGAGNTIPGSTNGDLVIKVYGKAPTGLDSNVTIYTYNSAKKVISLQSDILTYSSSSTLKSSVHLWWSFERDTSGLITQRKSYQVNSTNPIMTDTAVTMYYYTTGSSPMLKYSTSSTSLLGFTFSDSTVYTFNSAGRIAKSESYQTNLLITTPTLVSRIVYSYDANGNESKKETYSITLGVATLSSTQTFEWDNKTPAITYTEPEALIIAGDPAAIHNGTKTVLTSSTVNSTNTLTYTYNAAGKPATSVLKAVNSNFPDFTTNFTIYYQ